MNSRRKQLLKIQSLRQVLDKKHALIAPSVQNLSPDGKVFKILFFKIIGFLITKLKILFLSTEDTIHIEFFKVVKLEQSMKNRCLK